MLSIQQRVDNATRAVRSAWQAASGSAAVAETEAPEVIITTGSGLGALVDQVHPVELEMSYDDIPELPTSGVEGHAGRLIIGRLGGGDGSKGKKVVVLDGRIHGYEGHGPLTQVLPFLIASQLCGTSRLAIFTNAAGAINESYQVGQLVLIKDHINFTGSALVTFNEASDFGGQNMDMTFAYTPEHRRVLKEIAETKGLDLAEGVYVGVRGAMFETPAEIRAFRTWGADLVGMSTVHEVTAASRLEIDTVGISVVTNPAAGMEAKMLTHQEVLENTAQAASSLSELIMDLVLL